MSRPRKPPPAAPKQRRPQTPKPTKDEGARSATDDQDDDDNDDDDDDDDDQDDGDVMEGPKEKPSAQDDKSLLTEDQLRALGAMDDDSAAQNRALQQTLDAKSSGAAKVRWNSRGALLYDAAASTWGRNVGDKARVGLDLVRPVAVSKDFLPLTSVPTYQDLNTLIKQRYWKGDDCTFRWTLYTHGHCQRATDTISFEDDPIQKLEWRRRVEQAEKELVRPVEQPAQIAPQQWQQPAQVVPQQQWQHPAQTAPQQQWQQPAQVAPQQQQQWQQPAQVAPQQQQQWQQPAQVDPQQQQWQQPAQVDPQQPPPWQQPAQVVPQQQQPPWQQPAQVAPQQQQPPWQQPAQVDPQQQQPPWQQPAQVAPQQRQPPWQDWQARQDANPEDLDQDDDDDDDEPTIDAATQQRLGELEHKLLELQGMFPSGAAVPPPPVPPQARPEVVQIHRPRVDARRPQSTWGGQPQHIAPAPMPMPQPDHTQSAITQQLFDVTAELRGLREYIRQKSAMDIEREKLEALRAQQRLLKQQIEEQALVMAQQRQPIPAPAPAPVQVPAPAPEPGQVPNTFPFPGMAMAQGFPPGWPGGPGAIPESEPAKQPPAKDLPEYIEQVMGHVRVLQQAAVGLGYVPQQPTPAPSPEVHVPVEPPAPVRPPEPDPSLTQNVGQAAMAVAQATGMVPNPGEDELRIKEVGAYRIAFDKTGKPMDWLTQAMFNLDNIQGIWNQASQRFMEARQSGENEQRLSSMRQEMMSAQRQHQQQLLVIQRQMQEMHQQNSLVISPPAADFFEPPLPPRVFESVAAPEPTPFNGGMVQNPFEATDTGPTDDGGVPSEEPKPKPRGFLNGIDLSNRLVQ